STAAPTSNSTWNTNWTTGKLANSTFDTIIAQTSDWSWDATNNKLTYNGATPGTFRVRLALQLNVTVNGSTQQVAFYKNSYSTPTTPGNDGLAGCGVSTVWNNGNVPIIGDSWEVYLNPGDWVSPGVLWSGAANFSV